MDTRFGHPDDWGLSAQRHSEIANELSDHLDCLQADEGGDAAREAERKLARPDVRRSLTAAHIADQVCATLHRLPSRSDWRELGWLMFWFALAIGCDALAGYTASHAATSRMDSQFWQSLPGGLGALSLATWLLLGVSRTAFFIMLFKGVRDAWRLGWGVLIARLLQYKLIHTLMVVTGILLLHDYLGDLSGYGSLARADVIPPWLAPMLAGLLVLATLAAISVPRWRRAEAWLPCLLLLLFTYPASPGTVNSTKYTRPFPAQQASEDATHRYYEAITDPVQIQSTMARHVRSNGDLPDGWSMENPFIIYTRNEVSAAPLMAISQLMAAENTTSMKYKPIIWVGEHKEQLDPHATTPLLYPAGGLAWIAAPVPLMGVLGLLAMLFMMGRRGLLPALLYSVITFLALYCSVLPFVMTQSLSRIFQTGPLAVVRGPLPGFEQVLHFQEAMAGISVMAALVLSAGVPWLLTGLFLRGHEQEALPQDDDADLATG